MGKSEIDLEVSEQYTVGDLLREMDTRYGTRFREVMRSDPFERYVSGDSSSPLLLVNGRPVSLQKDLKKRLKKGDEVVFLPAMGGG